MSDDSANFTSFAPPGESSADLFVEKSNFNGEILAAWFHGILFVVFFLTMKQLLAPANRGQFRWSLVIYSVVMFSLGTVAFGTNTKLTQQMFIDLRNAPGGPNGANNLIFDSPIGIAANTAFIVANTLADGLLLYRCYVIWDRMWYVLIVPALLYLATFGLGVTLAVQLTTPNETIWATLAVNLTIPYFSMTISLNCLLTLLIAGRLMYHRSNTMKVLGKQHTGHYISITAMLVESAMLNVVFSMLFLVPFAIGNAVANLWLTVLGLVQITSPLLVIGRVASGEAYQSRPSGTANTGGSYPLNSIKFNPSNRQRSGSTTFAASHLESGGTKVTIRSQTEVDYPDYKNGTASY